MPAPALVPGPAARRLRPLSLAAVLGLAWSLSSSRSSERPGLQGQLLVRREGSGAAVTGDETVCPPDCTPEQLGAASADTTTEAPTEETTTATEKVETAADYMTSEVDVQQDPNLRVDGGGWALVRHVSGQRPTWGPWNDNLEGVADMGDDAGPQAFDHWTVPFSGMVVDELLLATADGMFWLITQPVDIKGSNYANLERRIRKSSHASHSYTMAWSNRADHSEDPLVTLDADTLMYAEANFATGVDFKNSHGGINVYVRERGAEAGGGLPDWHGG